MSYTQAGNCEQCGAPMWLSTAWASIYPPTPQRSCGCGIGYTNWAPDYNSQPMIKGIGKIDLSKVTRLAPEAQDKVLVDRALLEELTYKLTDIAIDEDVRYAKLMQEKLEAVLKGGSGG